MAARASSTIAVTRGSSAAIARTVNRPVSMRRSRVWSGGSSISSIPLRRRAISTAPSPVAIPGGGGTASNPKAGSPCTVRASWNPATSSARWPASVVTGQVASCSRRAVTSGSGSSPSRRSPSGAGRSVAGSMLMLTTLSQHRS